MTFGTLLTLFVVPTAYTLLARHRRSESFDEAPHPAPVVAPIPSHADD
jgi:hypothetical protein